LFSPSPSFSSAPSSLPSSFASSDSTIGRSDVLLGGNCSRGRGSVIVVSVGLGTGLKVGEYSFGDAVGVSVVTLAWIDGASDGAAFGERVGVSPGITGGHDESQIV